MYRQAGRRGPLRTVLFLLLVSILLDRLFIADRLPGLSGLGGITPALVFLDIPLRLPFVIGVVPVAALFCFLYLTVLFYKGVAWNECRSRIWKALTGLLVVLLYLLSGGLVYYLLYDHLPRAVRNGIDSFGLLVELHSSYPGYEFIHLKGGMLLLGCLVAGLRFFVKRVSRVPLKVIVLEEEPLSIGREEPLVQRTADGW
jgi:hypothetical protein